jgi:hypothetical protein
MERTVHLVARGILELVVLATALASRAAANQNQVVAGATIWVNRNTIGLRQC